MTESEFRDFMREQTLRHERASRSTEAWLRIADLRTREMIGRSEELIHRSDKQIEELRDLREESRAQRGALLALIDRLGPGPSTA